MTVMLKMTVEDATGYLELKGWSPSEDGLWRRRNKSNKAFSLEDALKRQFKFERVRPVIAEEASDPELTPNEQEGA